MTLLDFELQPLSSLLQSRHRSPTVPTPIPAILMDISIPSAKTGQQLNMTFLPSLVFECLRSAGWRLGGGPLHHHLRRLRWSRRPATHTHLLLLPPLGLLLHAARPPTPHPLPALTPRPRPLEPSALPRREGAGALQICAG